MKEFSVCIGGKAGFGIDTASLLIARICNRMGMRVFVYRDYPSLIRGGHTFSVIRASETACAACREKFDFLLALNQDTFNLHKEKLNNGGCVIFDQDAFSAPGEGLAISQIVKEENAPEIMRNTCMIGAFAKAAGIPWEVVDAALRAFVSKELDLNLKVARRGFDAIKAAVRPIEGTRQEPLPILTGNEAMGLGLVQAGLDTYIAYPMTPTSPVLHYLAALGDELGIRVIHPESEISVILMALGASYAGKKVAVGTSGGGFCLMTEGVSFSGMAELPVVIIMGQRPGPSTGLPTYSCQTELEFVLHAGQGEFVRCIVAPADAQEAFYWSGVVLNLAWKFQIPAFILSDKNMGESAYNFDPAFIGALKEEEPLLWDKQGTYKRYANTEGGISPFAFLPEKNAVIKSNSYEHDESGLTTEDPVLTKLMQDKRLHKENLLIKELEKYPVVNVLGNTQSEAALVCWGSNKGVSLEVAQALQIKLIQPVVLNPFPLTQIKDALKGVQKIICVESNATGQLARLLQLHGIKVNAKVLKYDGRPFLVEELQAEVGRALK